MNRPYIMIVEDSRADAELVIDALRENAIDADIFHFYDGEAAYAHIEQAAYAPVVILLDINMPRLGGERLIECVRSHPHGADVPIYVVSGSAAPMDVALGHMPNVTYFRKPDDICEYDKIALQIRDRVAAHG